MPRYIDAEKYARRITALVVLEWGYAGIDEDIKEIFNTIPAADVTPVVHGHWIGSEDRLVSCSVCRTEYYQQNLEEIGGDKAVPYCPNCGAKMDKNTEET